MCMARQCRHLNFDFGFIGRLKTSRRICGRSAAATKEIHTPFTPEQDEEPDEGRRALWEAFEEDAHPEVSDFQTGQSIRLSERRWHLPGVEPLGPVRMVRAGRVRTPWRLREHAPPSHRPSKLASPSL